MVLILFVDVAVVSFLLTRADNVLFRLGDHLFTVMELLLALLGGKGKTSCCFTEVRANISNFVVSGLLLLFFGGGPMLVAIFLSGVSK